MKIGIHSDLHLEFGDHDLDQDYLANLDVLILAGDIGVAEIGAQWASRFRHLAPHMEILYIPGNHEYYGQEFESTTKLIQTFCDENGIKFLHNRKVIVYDKVDGKEVTFVGGTLWTDFNLYPDRYMPAKLTAPNIMNDYRLIRGFDTNTAEEEHNITRKHIERTLKNVGSFPTKIAIVVTHHSPHLKSIDERFGTDLSNAYYASDLSDIINRYQPKVWVHGHTHVSKDYTLGDTRVICNPRGYFPYDINREYNPKYTIVI